MHQVRELLPNICCPKAFAGLKFSIYHFTNHYDFGVRWNRLKTEFMLHQILTQGYFIPQEWTVEYLIQQRIDITPDDTGGFHWHIVPIAPELKVNISISKIEDSPGGSTCKSCHLVLELLNDVYCLTCFLAFMDYRPHQRLWKGEGFGTLLADVTGIRQDVLEGTQPGQMTGAEENSPPGAYTTRTAGESIPRGSLVEQGDDGRIYRARNFNDPVGVTTTEVAEGDATEILVENVPPPPIIGTDLYLIVGEDVHNQNTFLQAGWTRQEAETAVWRFNATIRDDQQYVGIHSTRTGQTIRFGVRRTTGDAIPGHVHPDLIDEADPSPFYLDRVLIVGNDAHNFDFFHHIARFSLEQALAQVAAFNETMQNTPHIRVFEMLRFIQGRIVIMTVDIIEQTHPQLTRDDPVEIPGIEVEEIAYVEPVIRAANLPGNVQILEDSYFTESDRIPLRYGMRIYLRAGAAFEQGDAVQFGTHHDASVYPLTFPPTGSPIGLVCSDTEEGASFVQVQITENIDTLLITQPLPDDRPETDLLIPGYNTEYGLGQLVYYSGIVRMVKEILHTRDRTKITLMSLTDYLTRIQADPDE